MLLLFSNRRRRFAYVFCSAAKYVAVALLCLPIAAWGDQLALDVRSSLLRQSVHPERAADHAYTLNELLQIAQYSNPGTKGAGETAKQAGIAAQLVRSNYAPQLSIKALGGLQRTPIAIPDNVSPQGYFISKTREVVPSLELKWLLFDFGRRRGRENEADQTALAADAKLLGIREKLAFDVTRSYFELSSAQGRLRAARKVLETALISEEATSAERGHGRATVMAVAEAKRQSSAARLAVVKASGAERTASADLVSIVGLPFETDIEVSDADLVSSESASSISVKALVDAAVRRRPDVLSAQNQVNAAQAKVDTAHAAYRPTISVSAQLFQNAGQVSSDGSPYSSVNKPGGAVFIAVEMPLIDGGIRANDVGLAVSEKSEAEDKLDEVIDRASAETVRAYNDLQTGMEERKEADAYADASKTAFEATLASYKRGLATYPELASAEAALAQAVSAQVDATSDVQIAQSALALATGTLKVDSQE